MTHGNPLLKLHIMLTDLCASDIITEDEHDDFEDTLQEVLNRYHTSGKTVPMELVEYERHENHEQ